jgi:MFS family permease
VTWAGTSALIATTVSSLLYGRVSDIFGRKVMLVAALAVLALSQLSCGIATLPVILYVSRALAGASGGGVGNLVTIIAADVIPLRKRGQYMPLVAPFMILGNVCGPLLAATLVQYAGWRSFFWCLAPMSGAAALLALYVLPSTAPSDTFVSNLLKIDWSGSLASILAIASLMLPLTNIGTSLPWESPLMICSILVCITALLSFVYIEWRVAVLPLMPREFLQQFCDSDAIADADHSFDLRNARCKHLPFSDISHRLDQSSRSIFSAVLCADSTTVASYRVWRHATGSHRHAGDELHGCGPVDLH